MIQLILTVLITLSYCSLFLYDFKILFTSRYKHFICYSAFILLCISSTLATIYFNLYRTGIFLIMGVVMMGFLALFYINKINALYLATLYMFSIYSSRGIIVSICSLILSETIHALLKNPAYYCLIWIIAFLHSVFLDRNIFKKIAPNSKLKQLSRNTIELKFITTSQFFLMVYLLLIDDGRFRNLNTKWFSFLYLISCIMSKFVLLFLSNHAIHISALLEHELHTNQLREQLKRQMRHYQSYQKFTESFRAFKHDNNSMMSSLKVLIISNENEKAVELINEMQNSLHNTVMVHKMYSDHVIVDAIMQDAANLCEEAEIHFSCMLHLPSQLPLSDFNIVRVITNVLTNAIEACTKLDTSKRFIEIKSCCVNNWISIDITNSFNGMLTYFGEELVSSKQDKLSHGLGIKIVKEIIEDLGGFVHIESSSDNTVFHLSLHIPQISVE
ncbi:GHKL domain-containing protein [Lachnotalea glycerini]|uniref:GHKL domain-containing protein n=1 Tax=Lachnotalea glycerini TaxID=1763509 RepID=A0A318EK72_9FIRM|nr:ATP-binding protein [Lachnotalea glycerini]PXV86811.1 GHKL domain-containing protein [Lachnotalea glycerini]RDY29899.1 GHKL domain-containing protein [Lachnotalea glycerini]